MLKFTKANKPLPDIMMQPGNTKLESSRLYIVPLTVEQLILYKNIDPSLESSLGVSSVPRTLTDEVLSMLIHSAIPHCLIHPQDLLFGTLWLIIHKAENVIIGDIGFKGGPSDKGLIEVGYSTYPKYMNQGYMTEALSLMTQWAFSQPEINIILAETDKNNIASQKILNKNAFIPFAETDSAYWWRLDK